MYLKYRLIISLYQINYRNIVNYGKPEPSKIRILKYNKSLDKTNILICNNIWNIGAIYSIQLFIRTELHHPDIQFYLK